MDATSATAPTPAPTSASYAPDEYQGWLRDTLIRGGAPDNLAEHFPYFARLDPSVVGDPDALGLLAALLGEYSGSKAEADPDAYFPRSNERRLSLNMVNAPEIVDPETGELPVYGLFQPDFVDPDAARDSLTLVGPAPVPRMARTLAHESAHYGDVVNAPILRAFFENEDPSDVPYRRAAQADLYRQGQVLPPNQYNPAWGHSDRYNELSADLYAADAMAPQGTPTYDNLETQAYFLHPAARDLYEALTRPTSVPSPVPFGPPVPR